ncbi:MAG TPA: efflux RND transporter periplasmic adaptor subunit [Candidatus Angelobacter sp.]|jgi:HlyD family secretion protein|nr:efflux RND transporter periplasmic adaptor subunit [Candidatus Angelobacter sp.]
MKFIKNKWAIMGVLLAAIALLTAFGYESKKAPQYFTEKVQKGDIQNVVQATGTINAVTTVQVGSQVSGTIQTLFADFNSHVKKNQVIAQIDPSLFQGALLQAKADLADAQANLVVSKANLDKANAAAVQAKLDFNRYTTLAAEGVVPTQQLDTARATSQSADAAVGAAKAQVTQAAAEVQQKSAAVTVAQTNVEYSTIRSPIDGTVIARSVDVGQTVAASLAAPTLFTIAQDLTKMQVYVSTDESDVGTIAAGQEVNFKVDAFPKDTFKGKVSAVRLNATTVQNVVTYMTIVDFDNPDLKLFPGMTAYVTVPVATANDVVKVPNGALRYTPDLTAQQMSDLYQKAGIAAAGNGRKSSKATQQAQQATTAVVWKLNADKTLEPVQIALGITDHTTTEVAQVVKGSLNPQDHVVTGASAANKSASAAKAAPGMGSASGGRVGR